MTTGPSTPDRAQLKADLGLTFNLAIDGVIAGERFSAGIHVDDHSGEADPELIEQEDDTLIELVFLCDARAHVENDAHTLVNEVSWVDFAREGFQRVGRTIISKRDLGNTRLFNSLRDQFEAFEDMAERRKIVKGSSASDFVGLEYAYRVARGEIVLK